MERRRPTALRIRGFVLTIGSVIADNGTIVAQATRTGPGPYVYTTVLLTPAPLPPSSCGTEVSTAMAEARYDYVFPGTPFVLSFLAIGNKTSVSIPGPISLVMDSIGNGLYLGGHSTTACFSTQGGSVVTFAPGAAPASISSCRSSSA